VKTNEHLKKVLIVHNRPFPNLLSKVNNLLTRFKTQVSIRTISLYDYELTIKTRAILYDLAITDISDYADYMIYLNKFNEYSIVEHIMSDLVEVSGKFTDSLEIAKEWLSWLDNNFTELTLDTETDGFAIPQFNKINMIGFGLSYESALVILFTNKEIRDYVLNWVVTTNIKFILHNALYDFRHIYDVTHRMPKHLVEDSQLLASVYRNTVGFSKKETGLKVLGSILYSNWAESKETFELYKDSSRYSNPLLEYVGSNEPAVYNLPLIYYLFIDTTATRFIYDKFNSIEVLNNTRFIMPTSEPSVNKEKFNSKDYYEYILKPSIPMIVEVLAVGQGIDLAQVYTLKEKVLELRTKDIALINTYPLVQKFFLWKDHEKIEKFLKPVYEVLVMPEPQEFKDVMENRVFAVAYYYPEVFGLTHYLDDPNLLDRKISKKDLLNMDLEISRLIYTKDYTHPKLIESMHQLAWYKSSKNNLNSNRIDKILNYDKYLDLGFAPYNYVQLKAMWLDLGLESPEISKETGEQSFTSTVLKELVNTQTGEVKEIISRYLEISEAKNITTQYIPKYIHSTVDNRVFGNLSLLGTISGRLSGASGGKKKDQNEEQNHNSGINNVTQPSSGSKYSKPVKQLFIAPEGKILAMSDYSGLTKEI